MNQLNLFETRAVFAVTTTPEIDQLLAVNAPVAIGVSGGKDSGVAAWATVNHLRQTGHSGPVVLVHSDLGRIEWKDSLPVCQRLADRLELPLHVVRRKAGGMVERWQVRWENNVARYQNLECVKLILPWSTPSMRFCTSELKSAIIARALLSLFPGQHIISVTGIRRQESVGRAKSPVSSENKRIVNLTKGTKGTDWNPVIDWQLDEVWACHNVFNLPVHEAYTMYGSSRVSCSFCIMQSWDDMVKSASCPDNQDVYRELCELEITSAFSFQGRWLSDVAPRLLTDDMRERLVRAKRIAREREAIESRIPKHLEYTKGWPTCIPTVQEATLLADVRTEVSALMGLNASYTTPESVIQRYHQLMK